MITLDHVTKRYLKTTALRGINLHLETGKIYGLIGSNGSGKSTTLKLIAGLIQPTKGTIKVEDIPVDRRIASKVSYLSELDEYYGFYTVQQTIDFFGSQFPDFNHEKAEDIRQFMKLDSESKVKHLSKGNRGRLKILLTLAREVPVILMDEPLSGLDPMVRDSIVKGLISFIDLEHQVVIITTHEIKEVETLLDEVIAIKDGEIAGQYNVDDLRIEQNMNIVEWMTRIYE
ncbi:ABC-2 type transport system ATP-binding protein [Pullulanibacillus pueri]|uniref:Putative ABC transporter ATP-binding protein YhcG n=1 Tax=Pullulanibacillus pueri TaxID=1437324 RepID=A0A8J2ZR46_9BACL|nr:ABC transporter ATP-binding protein [Pullulanibacillus pueri]MBM7680029.1 ABC-2 type transport system ATP-binding protein [Pullulanibacillus pueri]GGH74014.1 putative ABC transporter ATP-binding protein YhcG [Pullulanibacillus pueri]